MNNTNFLIRRAAAEGFSVAKIISAAEKVQTAAIDALPTGYQQGDKSIISVKEMAEKVSTSTRYVGGYMYPGADFGSSLREYQPKRCSSVGGDKDGNFDAALKALSELPEGARVVEHCNLGNGTREDVYEKSTDGDFVHVSYIDEKSELELRNYGYRTPHAVAEMLQVPCSNTFLDLYHAVVK